MASKKKNHKSNDPLAKLGIDIPKLDDFDDEDDSDDGDDDLESELQALLSGKQGSKPIKRPKPVPQAMDIEKMAAECMREPSIDDDDDDVSGDESLLAELHSLTKIENHESEGIIEEDGQLSSEQVANSAIENILQERLDLYKKAELASKAMNDSSKSRRYRRAIKTLEGLLSSAKAGCTINEDDIPPVVSLPKPKVLENVQKDTEFPEKASAINPLVLSKPEASVPQATLHCEQDVQQTAESTVIPQLISRRNQYKLAALNAKKSGDKETALKYVKIAKKFDVVIEAAENGKSVDLANMPPSPVEFSGVQKSSQFISPTAVQAPSTESELTQGATSTSDIEAAAMVAAKDPADPSLFDAPHPPATILEALEQRLQKYCSTRDSAKAEGNNSKARRLHRIVQQYEGAIKSYKAGKTVAFDELPTPPGFAPIPVSNGSIPDTSAKESENSIALSQDQKGHPSEKSSLQKDQPAAHDSVSKEQPLAHDSVSKQQPPSGMRPKLQRANTSKILEKQLNFLLERQKLFRQAALESKKNGDIQQAKEYLRMSKGFDSMIEATKCGLPIDATTIPTPPQLETDFVIVDESECIDSTLAKDNIDPFSTLEKELQDQIEMCVTNKEHFMLLGDVSSASKFEKLCLETKKDLTFIQHLWRNGEPVPHFHYETRLFSLVQCNTDLADNELELIVERGINLPGKPDDLDAYVKIEFPIPSENPQRAKTHTIKDTNNPIFHEAFKFEINRKSRSQLRQFKRQTLKLEVWSKGGFFRGDSLLGTVIVKLVDLETKCLVHDSFDLLDGRKVCGGKLEIKIRIRDPLLTKQVEEVKEKWLVIGS